jgi:phenylacetate-coenzyme A ligase PaaK-like adenylate-forming protein
MTGSRWRAAESCGRGLPLIAPTLGRSVDHVALANGTLVVPYSLTCAVEAIEGMQQYQFVQTQADVVELRVVPNVEFIDPVRAERQVPHS